MAKSNENNNANIDNANLNSCFYKLYNKLLVEYSAKITHNTADSENIVQDVFLKIFTENTIFNNQQHALNSLKLIVKHRSFDLIKLNNNNVEIDENRNYRTITDNYNHKHEQADENKIRQRKFELSTIVSKLNMIEQKIYFYRVIEKISYKKLKNMLNKLYNKKYTANSLNCSFRRLMKCIKNQLKR